MVGIVGGCGQGGGHGALQGLYGLAADNTLEFEVVTAKGEHLKAAPTENADLYWAFNNGGGRTTPLSCRKRPKPMQMVA